MKAVFRSKDLVSGCRRRGDQFAVARSAHLQRRLAGAPAQGFHEVGSIRESGASPDLRGGHAIEQRRLKHAHGEIDASLDQRRSERVATGAERPMQGSRRYTERTRNVGRLQGCISAALSDVIVRMVTQGAFGCC